MFLLHPQVRGPSGRPYWEANSCQGQAIMSFRSSAVRSYIPVQKDQARNVLFGVLRAYCRSARAAEINANHHRYNESETSPKLAGELLHRLVCSGIRMYWKPAWACKVYDQNLNRFGTNLEQDASRQLGSELHPMQLVRAKQIQILGCWRAALSRYLEIEIGKSCKKIHRSDEIAQR